MTPEEELADLRTKLKARLDKPGLAVNIAALQARIAELESAA